MAQTCSIPASIVLDIEWLRSLEKSLFTRLRRPLKMSKPCSQLNSKVIRDKVECHIVAAIEKTCSVVAFKCVWRVSDEEIQQAWNWICEKRDECDLELSKLSKVCFFFSAISISKLDSKKKKSRTSDEGCETDESSEESAIIPSQISTPGKQVFPAISYWVACQTQNGSAVNPMKIQRALGKCGLEFYLSRASRKKNSHDLNQLCQVLKDHKNPCLMNFVEASYQHCLRLVYSIQNYYSKGNQHLGVHPYCCHLLVVKQCL